MKKKGKTKTRERERAKKTQDYTQNSKPSNRNGPTKKKNKKNTCVSPAATGICPKFGAQKNTTPKKKRGGVWRRFP
jgi:hypothetical protein